MNKLNYTFAEREVLTHGKMQGLSDKVDEIVDALNEGTGLTVHVNEDTGTLQFIL